MEECQWFPLIFALDIVDLSRLAIQKHYYLICSQFTCNAIERLQAKAF